MKSLHRVPRAAVLLAAIALSAPARADTLIDNVEGVTFGRDGSVERLNGVVIGNDGRIVQVLHRGDKRPARVDYLLDGKGRFLLPGLVDGHAEVMALGLAALTLDLSETKSLAEAQGRVAAYAAAHPDRAWIVGRGWDMRRWGAARFPGAADLDAVEANRPVWLISADGHTGWANSAALRAAGITALTKAPVGGRIERDTPAGKPNGVLVETAQALVDKVVPAPRPEDRDLAFAGAQELLLSRGITTVTDMGTTIEDWQSYRRSGDAGALRLRVIAYAAGTEAMSLIGGPGPTPWLYDDRLRLNGVRLVLDGGVATQGAWMKAPYPGAPPRTGLPQLNPTQLRNLMSRAAIDRFQIAVEAHGDAAATAALDAVQELADTYKGDRRWRIEGLESVGAPDIARFAAAGVIAGMRAAEGPSAPVAKSGVMLAFGTGASAGTPSPFAAVALATTQAEPMTREAALAAFTGGAAQAAFAETRIGRIAPGLRADFILVDRDPLLAGASELAQVKVLETWVGGRRVWSAGGPAASR